MLCIADWIRQDVQQHWQNPGDQLQAVAGQSDQGARWRPSQQTSPQPLPHEDSLHQGCKLSQSPIKTAFTKEVYCQSPSWRQPSPIYLRRVNNLMFWGEGGGEYCDVKWAYLSFGGVLCLYFGVVCAYIGVVLCSFRAWSNHTPATAWNRSSVWSTPRADTTTMTSSRFLSWSVLHHSKCPYSLQTLVTGFSVQSGHVFFCSSPHWCKGWWLWEGSVTHVHYNMNTIQHSIQEYVITIDWLSTLAAYNVL